MALRIPQTGAALVDKLGRATEPLNALWQQLKNALILTGGYTTGDIIVFNSDGTVSDGGPVPVVHITHTRVVLTNAQIKALPTTPQTLIAAPGAASLLAPVLVNVHTSASFTAYTNIDPDALLYVVFDPSGAGWSNGLANDSVIGFTWLTDAIGTSTAKWWQYVPATLAEPTVDWGNLAYTQGAVTNNALQLLLSNNGAGDLTGGAAGNTLTLDTYYATVAA